MQNLSVRDLVCSLFLLIENNYFIQMHNFIIHLQQTEMKPNRPGSAKSNQTRVTVDSEISSNALNVSKFSETYSNGVKAKNQKNNDFHKYVSEKNKDPRFKKFVEGTMPEIPENMDNSLELSKLTSKPFEKKTSKIEKSKPQKKVEQPTSKKQPSAKNIKNQNTTKSFIDKSKLKMKITTKKQPQPEETKTQKNGNVLNINNVNTSSNGNQRIILTGFTVKLPGKAPQAYTEKEKSERKIEQEKKRTPEQIEEQRKIRQRERLFSEISEYVSDLQSKNYEYFPDKYDAFVDDNLSKASNNMDIEIQKINIEDFMNEPNQRDYDQLMKRINQCDRKINESGEEGRKKIVTDSSINLEDIIDGDTQKQDSEMDAMMSEMSASDVRERNMFLTQILKGKRLTKQNLESMQKNDESRLKIMKIQKPSNSNSKKQQQQQEQLEEEESQEGMTGLITQLRPSTISSKSINFTKKKNNKFLERNKIEAAGQLYRQCDYLTPQEQQRIEDLINGVPIESPFEVSEMESFKNRRIDEGIKIHRQMHRGENDEENQGDIINEATLPKDPLLKKEAELKMMKEKITSVNSRLREIDSIAINQTKIKALAQRFKQKTRLSIMGEKLIAENNREMQEEIKRMKEAEEIIEKALIDKEEINEALKEMEKEYEQMEIEMKKIQEMDEKELKRMQEEDLKSKKRRVQQVEEEFRNFDEELNGFVKLGEELRENIRVLDQIMNFNQEKLECQDYNQNQTIEDLDKLIVSKWQAAEQAVKDISLIQEEVK